MKAIITVSVSSNQRVSGQYVAVSGLLIIITQLLGTTVYQLLGQVSENNSVSINQCWLLIPTFSQYSI